MDAEVRNEQAEYEAMALQARWRTRRIVDVAREVMVRGDPVEVLLPGLVLRGLVVHVGEDLFVVDAWSVGPVDVAVRAGPRLRPVEDGQGEGLPPGRGARIFVARLTEHEVTGQRMVVALDDGDRVEGLIAAVAVDHVLLEGPRGEEVLPFGRIVAVWTAP